MNTWEEYCQQKYYLTYVLGLQDTPNIKTEVGTVVHAVFEILAGMKHSFQLTGRYEYEHPGIGLVKCSKTKFLKPYTLSDEEVDKINKSRKNKTTYKDQIKVPYKNKRYGVDNVQEIINACYKYYSEKSENEWTNIQYRDCVNFTWMVLDWRNGIFDPRKRNVIFPEYPFDIEIDKDWAKLPNGENLRIKGTIDLVTEIDTGVIEIVDWKTGQRYNWGKGKEKTYEDLLEDTQLMLYYYAARKSFPEYDSIMFTIFFLRDGGPFTLPFDDDIIPEIEKRIKKTFLDIKNCKKPKMLDRLHKDFRCNKLCGFYKDKIGDSCVCDYNAAEIDVYGIEKAAFRNRAKGFSVGHYQNPGE